jgi:hypothetical protein
MCSVSNAATALLVNQLFLGGNEVLDKKWYNKKAPNMKASGKN